MLTRDDSLAIARAIQKKLGEQQTTVSARAESAMTPSPAAGAARTTEKAAANFAADMGRFADSLRAEIQKAVLDSVTRVRGVSPGLLGIGDARVDSVVRRLQRDAERRGTGRSGPEVFIQQEHREPPMVRPNALSREAFAARLETLGPPRRLFVSFPTLSSRTRFLQPQLDSLVDSLRRALGRDPRYVLIPGDSVREMLARTRTISRISDSMKVDLFVSVAASVMPDTSIIWQVTTRDLSAHSTYHTRALTTNGKRPDLLRDIDSLVVGAARFLREQDRAPRRSTSTRER